MSSHARVVGPGPLNGLDRSGRYSSEYRLVRADASGCTSESSLVPRGPRSDDSEVLADQRANGR